MSTEQDTDHRGDEGGGEPHNERRLTAVHEPTQDVEARAVGPQWVTSLWCTVLDGAEHGLLVGLVGVVDVRPDEAEQHEGHDDDEPDHGHLVLDEDATDLDEHAAALGRLAPLGDGDQLHRRDGLAHTEAQRQSGAGGVGAEDRILVDIGHAAALPNLMRGSATA
jgi:hypothetical protein